MSLLEVVGEEEIAEDSLCEYFQDLYKVVCVSDRLSESGVEGNPIRTTYIVDWEQLVHLLEDYFGFGEDIVEVARIRGDESKSRRPSPFGAPELARA